jgi:hypothetical protein
VAYCDEAPEGEPCCDTCHEEADQGVYPLIDIEVNGVAWILCCARLRNLEAAAT